MTQATEHPSIDTTWWECECGQRPTEDESVSHVLKGHTVRMNMLRIVTITPGAVGARIAEALA